MVYDSSGPIIGMLFNNAVLMWLKSKELGTQINCSDGNSAQIQNNFDWLLTVHTKCEGSYTEKVTKAKAIAASAYKIKKKPKIDYHAGVSPTTLPPMKPSTTNI